jgi:FlgD Ig-like domain
MKGSLILSLLISLTIVSFAFAQDTTFITGGTLSGGENAGMLESTINGDTTSGGARVNPNRVYALYEGQVYFQLAPIDVSDPTGTLSIIGVPDPNNPSATEKPIIVIVATNGTDVVINGGGVNLVYGSLKFDNIYYQTQETDGTQENELFYCGTKNNLPQSLTINNCVFEFSNIDLFDCTNESGAIGGWPYGAKFKITNSYFRNLFFAGQWWGSRVFQCKHPIDTLWVENNTITTGGLTFLQQNELADFVYINHNTIINNKKYWLLSPYRHNEYITNNIFVNQNWVGEDTNVTNSGQDPDKIFMSTIDIDTNIIRQSAGGLDTNGVQSKYESGGQVTSDLSLSHMHVYVSNNVNFNDPLLASAYYNNSAFLDDTSKKFSSGLPSFLNWAGAGSGPWLIENVPGEWMNSRTQGIFNAYSPANGGGFVEENTITSNPNMVTPGIADASVATLMGQWNQNQWGDPRYATAPDIVDSKYIYGDYLATTLPGINNGTKTDNITANGSGIQVGITKFTDFTENFSQTTDMSTIDNLPIGSLIWDDSQNAAFNSASDWQLVQQHYQMATGIKDLPTTGPKTYSLSQNYPNPFNPSTVINFSVPKTGIVKLIVYNSLGQQIRTLVNQNVTAGSHSITWDGMDSRGMSVSSGVYFYRLSAGSDFVAAKKMILLK